MAGTSKKVHTKVNNAGLCRIISCLKLRDIDNMTAHARGGDEASVRESSKRLSVQGRALLLLPPPMLASILCAKEGAVKISSNDFAVVGIVAVQHRPLCPWNTSVGNEYVKTTVELGDDCINGMLDLGVLRDIYLVRSA